MVPMTTSHGPGDDREGHDQADRQGNDRHAGDRAQHSVKMRLPSSGNTLWLIANAVLIVLYRNLIQAKHLLAIKIANRTLPKWFRGYR
jgi:hypothetical protein